MQKPLAILCDIDGTLALLGNRDPFDLSHALDDMLNHPIAHILEVYEKQTLYNVSLFLITGRHEKYRQQTEQWLRKHSIIHYEALYMRANDDFRKDFIAKKEIYETHIKQKYNVLFVLEDRDQAVKMWREIGLTCLQVSFGNY